MCTALFSQISAPSAEPSISVQTALLLIMAAVLAVVVKELVGMRRRLTKLERQTRAPSALNSSPTATAASPTVAPAVAPGGLDGETMAAISAAVYMSYGSRSRILAIMAPTPDHVKEWSAEGRRQVFQSHRVR
jgi:hypothetical protein